MVYAKRKKMREGFVYLAAVMLAFLRVDWWWWGEKIEPFILGWFTWPMLFQIGIWLVGYGLVIYTVFYIWNEPLPPPNAAGDGATVNNIKNDGAAVNSVASDGVVDNNVTGGRAAGNNIKDGRSTVNNIKSSGAAVNSITSDGVVDSSVTGGRAAGNNIKDGRSTGYGEE